MSLQACAHLRAMSQRCVAPLGHDTKILSRPSLLSRVSQRLCAVSQGAGCRIAAMSRIVSQHKATPLSHDTMLVSQLPPLARPRAQRAVACPCPWAGCVVALAGSVSGQCSGLTTQCRGLPLRALGRPYALDAHPVSQAMPVKPCVTIQLAVL